MITSINKTSIGCRLITGLFLVTSLIACGEETKKSVEPDWVADEILQQLVELRKDVKSIKLDIAKLNSTVSSAVNKRRSGNAPKQVKLNSGIMFGDDKAKTAIVEFTDYQCPYCARHAKTVLPQIQKDFIDTRKAKYVMYDFPLGFHAQAKFASVAARCAGKQGKYREMHDLIFENQRKLSHSFYEESAKTLRLNMNSFKSCIEDPEVLETVESNIEYGSQLGVTGTPRFYVGRVVKDVITDVVVISGAQAFSAFNRVVNNKLNERK